MTTPAIHCAYDELRNTNTLRPHPRNPNEHPKSQVRLLAKVIAETGWRAPITVSTRSGFVTRGHGRLLAAQHLKLEKVPVDLQAYATDSEELADLVADNKIAELSNLDADAVASILGELDTPHLAGYEPREVDLLLRSVDVAAHKRSAREVPLPKTRPEKLRANHGTDTGQIWQTEDEAHTLVIGDATHDTTYPDRVADLVFTDPPYGVVYEGKTADALTIDNDDLDEGALADLLETVLGHAFSVLKPGGAVYCCSPPGPLFAVFARILQNLDAHRQTICWVKDQFVLGRQDYHWRHENILYGWKPGAAHYYAPGDRTQDTVWEIDTLEQDTVWRYPRPKRSAEHPTMKPVELVGRAIANSTRPGELVLDTFAGSGSTAVAAAQLGRRSHSIELDPAYAAVIVERLAAVGVNLQPIE